MFQNDQELEDQIKEFHATQLAKYLQFARKKREQHLRDIATVFSDTKEARYDQHYTKSELDEILDGLCGVVKEFVQKELLHASHTSTLILRSMFTQAETIFFQLHFDMANMENEQFLKEIAQFEEMCLQRDKDPNKKNLVSLHKLSDKAMAHTLQVLAGANKQYKDRFMSAHQKASEIAKEKTELSLQLEEAKQTIFKLSKRLEELATKPELAPTSNTDSLKAEITALKASVEQFSQKEKESKLELEKKLNNSTPFLNMKKMIAKKNEVIKSLREALQRVDPTSEAAIKEEVD